MTDFKIYVTTLDEDVLIAYTLEALLKVFSPKQIEVIDLGSQDNTLKLIPAGIKVHREHLPEGQDEFGVNVVGPYFTELKRRYSKRQDWVFWVDGDEIYPVSTLLSIQSLMKVEPGKRAFRFYWRMLKYIDDELYASDEYVSAGSKLFNSNYFQFHRAWPKEVLQPIAGESGKKDKNIFTGLWLWHGVLLERSSLPERTARSKKRLAKIAVYDKTAVTWNRIIPPWESDYATVTSSEWVVIDPRANISKKGRL